MYTKTNCSILFVEILSHNMTPLVYLTCVLASRVSLFVCDALLFGTAAFIHSFIPVFRFTLLSLVCVFFLILASLRLYRILFFYNVYLYNII